MATLRQRFLLATGLLLGLQLASTALALGSWRQVLDAARHEQELAEWRADVAALGAAVREQYVHQAHTYIEGGAGHLDHGRDVELAAEAGLDRLAQLPLPAATVEAIAQDQTLLTAYFHDVVEPEVRAGTLDRARAAELHRTTETVTSRLTANLERLLVDLDARQAAERERAQLATARAWWATAALTVGGILLVLAIGRALAQAVLAPVDAIRAAAQGVTGGEGQDELGEIAQAFGTVTRRLEAEQDRRVRAERLAALGEMSAAIAHELMNPLAVILGELDLRRDPALAPIREEAQHARRVVDGLLGFARPGKEAPEAVDVGAVAQDAVDRVLPTAELADVAIALGGGGSLVAPPTAVRQVVENLVRNAVQASPPGARVEVEVSADRLVVLDRGAGLPDLVRTRLYEPFVTGRADGTGLGLAICQRIVRAQGGALSHVDRPGGGTVATWIFAVAEREVA